jgi:hypothetical protein
MTLEQVTAKLSKVYSNTTTFLEKEKSYLVTAGIYCIVRIGDGISTSLASTKCPDGSDLNTIPRYFMDHFGTNLGLTICYLVTTSVSLGAAYYLNSLTKNSENFLFKNFGTKFLGLTSGIIAIATFNNLSIYFR